MSISITDTPIEAGGLSIKNRVWLAPLTRGRCGRDQVPKSHSVAYYVQRAGAGMLISEATVISKQGMGWSGAPAIYDATHVEGWKRVTEAVHKEGGIMCCQLWHMGRVTHSDFHGLTPVSASAIAAEGRAHLYDRVQKPYQVPRALETHELEGVVEEYRHAAACAKEAGFDAIEVHSANGYLLDQFLSSASNKREDAYGGSAEARFRLLREVLAAVGTVFPMSRVGVRLSPNGSFNGMGAADNFDSFSFFIGELDKLGLMYLHIMDGLGFGYHGKAPVFRAAHARALFKGIIVGNCGYSKESAEGAINTGALDAVAFGRPFISNPDLVERFRRGWPLAPPAPYSVYYDVPGDMDDVATQALGYSDFPAYAEPPAEGK